jgi:predicted  nucleic acid-binding Zn-ribbon protein
MLQLLVCKARYGLSDASFDVFLSIIADMLPKENKVPANTYYAKKLISPLMMGVEKIHTCRNHCILYRGANYKDLDNCPNCGASRYKTNKDYREEERVASLCKGKKRKRTQQKTQKSSSKPTNKEKQEVDYYAQKKIPVLVMWYLPVVDRLRCLFANLEDAKLMSWHASDQHKDDGKLLVAYLISVTGTSTLFIVPLQSLCMQMERRSVKESESKLGPSGGIFG